MPPVPGDRVWTGGFGRLSGTALSPKRCDFGPEGVDWEYLAIQLCKNNKGVTSKSMFFARATWSSEPEN